MVRGLLLLLLAVASGSLWAAVEAEVDRSRLYRDETLELTVRADPETARFPLELTSLSTLFEVVQQTQGQRLRRATNGDMQPWREWRLVLRPRLTGTLTLPGLRLGAERTEPMLIEVLDPAARSDELPAEAVRLSVRLEDRELYVGQPTRLTIDLRYQLRLQGNYQNLSFGDFNAELLDESNITDYQGNRQFRLYRLEYRLSADQPGELRLPPIRFSGQYQNGPYGELRSLQREHPAMTVQVKPIPAEYPADAAWLPADSLTLSDNLPDRLSLAAHAHQDWTVTAEVVGLPPTRLPDPLAGLGGEHWRLYRNAPEFDASSRRDLAALVFTEAGQQSLPAVRLPWWDLKQDRLAYAELPARQVEVLPEASPAFQPTPASVAERPMVVRPDRVWPWVSLALALGWLATLLVWYGRRRRALTPAAPAPPTKTVGLKAAELVDEDDPGAFRARMQRWLVQQKREPGAELTALRGSAAKVWRRLNASLYGPRSVRPPNRDERRLLLATLIKNGKVRRRRRSDPTRLYPDD